jgi:hypothetical protein
MDKMNKLLAYRKMLERHFIDEGHYSSLEELAEVEKLLKESVGGVKDEAGYKIQMRLLQKDIC